MNIVFAGPTINHVQVSQYLDCVCLSPVGHGDVLAVLGQSPHAIGIIDGYFEGAPSVWHKEILYAMDQGVKVYGSASMGALRAAELCDFGMVGVGQIFESYRDGLLEDDDEVAVVHGPEETGYMAASVPMVNIRATLELAQNHRVIDCTEKTALINQAKGTFYKQRSWNNVLRASAELFAEKSTVDAFQVWLASNKVDQKRHDAVQMLKLMNEPNTCASSETAKAFYFQWTNVWDEAFREHQQSPVKAMPLGENEQSVLDQLRQSPDLYRHYRDKALLSWTSRNKVDIEADEQARKAALNAFREHNRLHSRTQLINYMESTGLTESSLTSLLTDAANVDLARQAAGDLNTDIIGQLKLDGLYLQLLAQARAESD